MFRIVPVVCSLALVSAALSGSVVQSTFDADAEGWGTLNDATSFTWTDELGNPGGSIRATDQSSGQWWFFAASDAYLGDKSSYFGGELSWDIYGIIGNQNTINRADVMLAGGGITIGINGPVAPVNGQWTSWMVKFDTSANWRRVSSVANGTLNSTPATVEDFQIVLADLEGVYIRGEYTVGADSTAIDNVRLAPPPCGDADGDGDVDLDDLNIVLTNFGFETETGDLNDDGVVDLNDLNILLTQFGGNC
jgi:hypothetical protein